MCYPYMARTTNHLAMCVVRCTLSNFTLSKEEPPQAQTMHFQSSLSCSIYLHVVITFSPARIHLYIHRRVSHTRPHSKLHRYGIHYSYPPRCPWLPHHHLRPHLYSKHYNHDSSSQIRIHSKQENLNNRHCHQ